ncbi:unnamed protein product [Cyprideis torosa]|uniref:Uncharacterized protein n=1 Tax=Cyprideis torosa TaxID=163714 RepID=A0A7R8WG98_9CRUS|nr:unnamed protein product [Cyprideis torosa]CAG0892710.1 unnamed protein product [Cyprideis torosa]
MDSLPQPFGPGQFGPAVLALDVLAPAVLASRRLFETAGASRFGFGTAGASRFGFETAGASRFGFETAGASRFGFETAGASRFGFETAGASRFGFETAGASRFGFETTGTKLSMIPTDKRHGGSVTASDIVGILVRYIVVVLSDLLAYPFMPISNWPLGNTWFHMSMELEMCESPPGKQILLLHPDLPAPVILGRTISLKLEPWLPFKAPSKPIIRVSVKAFLREEALQRMNLVQVRQGLDIVKNQRSTDDLNVFRTAKRLMAAGTLTSIAVGAIPFISPQYFLQQSLLNCLNALLN